jgi:SfnB family sulfur acquisition oxidoreductase
MLIEPIVPAQVIRTDEEAISVADEVAKIIRKGAIDRDQKRLLPQVEVELLSQRGLYGLSVPKKYGGAGVSNVTVGNVFRILAAADPSIAQIPQNHFCWSAVLWLGTPEQEAFFFAKFLAGERLGNAASENTRKRPGDHETVAKKLVGGYAVTGKKYYSTGALFAHWIPVFAKDEEDRSIILFVRQGSEGLEIVDDWAGMGQRTTASGTTILNNVFVPDLYVIPFYKIGEGSQIWTALAGYIHGAIDLGIAEEALDDTKDYIRTKNRPWSDNPFDEHAKEPFIVKRFGELVVELHAAQALLRRAGEAIDSYYGNPTEQSCLEARFAVADFRLVAGRVAVDISGELFPLTGARATLAKYNLDRHWRNARTHTLHDPDRWKAYHIGNYFLNGTPPPPGSYV